MFDYLHIIHKFLLPKCFKPSHLILWYQRVRLRSVSSVINFDQIGDSIIFPNFKRISKVETTMQVYSPVCKNPYMLAFFSLGAI